MKLKDLDLKYKFLICIVYDAIDFFMPPVIGHLYDVAGVVLSYKLWGAGGLYSLWETVELSERIDAFIPTQTLIAIFINKEKIPIIKNIL